MILKKFLNTQALNLIKNFLKNNKEIYDIAVYGSLIRGKIKPSDIDLALIFLKDEKLDKKLSLAQDLKSILKNEIGKLDIKSVSINDIFDETFLARKAILSEGFLIVRNKFLHELLGFRCYYLFSYNLKNLNQSKKIMFSYALNGRRGEEGILKRTSSEHIGNGVIKVKIEHSEEFMELFSKNNINYKYSKILEY